MKQSNPNLNKIDLKTFILGEQKPYITSQFFVDFDKIIKDITIKVNKNSSSDLKREYWYSFIDLLKEICILFAKSYIYKDITKKIKYSDRLEEIFVDIDVYLHLFDIMINDIINLGISKHDLVELHQNIGKLESQFQYWKDSLHNKRDNLEESNQNKLNKLKDLYKGN